MKKSTENITNTNLVKPKQVTKRKLDCDDISEEILADLANTAPQTEGRSNQKSKKFKPNVDSGSDNIHSSVEENILKLYL